MVKLAFCDTETVRLTSDHGSAIWECAIVLRNGPGRDEEYLWQIRPSLEHADAAALRIGGYYERCRVADRAAGSGMVLSHPKLPGKTAARAAHLIALDVAKLLDGALIVGANPWFDADHLGVFLHQHGQALAADYHLQNIGSLVNGYLAGRGESTEMRPLKLSAAAAAVGLNPDDYAAHSALGDARLAKAIYDAVMQP